MKNSVAITSGKSAAQIYKYDLFQQTFCRKKSGICSLDGKWDFFYSPQKVTENIADLPAAEEFTGKMVTPGYWDDWYELFDEEDFLSAEIEVVPAGAARDFGLDRSMISGYGHDDRVCAYTSLKAVLDIEAPEYTSCAILVDKEEIGSVGATGAHSVFFENCILKLLALQGKESLLALRETMENTKMLSSDVSAGVDPLFLGVNDPKNAAYLGRGVVFNKYTGSRGKSGCNDAMPEYIAWLRKIMDENNVNFQTSELGRVDQGGGGTIAYILGNYNMNVIDCGVPVLNMHSPWEVVSKADVYETYNAYKVFLTK